MELKDKIQMMNSLLDLDRELTVWKATCEADIESKAQELRQSIQDLRLQLQETQDAQLEQESEISPAQEAAALRLEAEGKAAQLQQFYQSIKADLIAQLCQEALCP